MTPEYRELRNTMYRHGGTNNSNQKIFFNKKNNFFYSLVDTTLPVTLHMNISNSFIADIEIICIK